MSIAQAAGQGPMMAGGPLVQLRPVQSEADVRAVVQLTASNFPEECGTPGAKGGAGLTLREWSALETEDLLRQPWLWGQIGLAVEQGGGGEDKVLGCIVLSYENQRDGTMSYWEVSKRVGCLATIHNYLYDQVLEEPLKDHECLIDFIAVSHDARGKGVGARLMEWGQETGAAILMKQWPEAVAAHGPLMSLWVAADNAVALKLYRKAGYEVVHRTDDGVCHCIASRMLKAFLGHPVWYKMSKALPAPAPSFATALAPPEQLSIPISVAAGTVAAAMAGPAATSGCAACSGEAGGEAGECQLRIPAHNPAAATLPPPTAASLCKCSSGLGLAAGTPSFIPAPTELAPKASLLLGGGGSSNRRNSSSGGDGRAVTPVPAGAQESAPPLLVQQLARTLSNTMAAASIAQTMRRASEGSEPCSQAPAARPLGVAA